jgi:hypothetical protein
VISALNKRKWERKLDPAPSGRAWYGNYTGPGNERSDWEEEHLPPQTPLDRAPMQHDQEYSRFEEKYGYGRHETDPDGKRRFYGDKGSFFTMRLDTDNESLHTDLIESDLRLMWRAPYYTLEGVASGRYDLTFSKGPLGLRNLATDSLATAAILHIFPLLITMDVAMLGVTVTKHGLEGAGEVLYEMFRPGPRAGDPRFAYKEMWDLLRYKPFPNATTANGIKGDILGFRINLSLDSEGELFGIRYKTGGKGKLFGVVPYELGMRNTTVLDIGITIAVYLYMGGMDPSTGPMADLGFGWIEDGTNWAIAKAISWAVGWVGHEVSKDAIHFDVGAAQRRAASGIGRAAAPAVRGAKAAGGRASDWVKSAGGKASSAAKDAGGKVADEVKKRVPRIETNPSKW